MIMVNVNLLRKYISDCNQTIETLADAIGVKRNKFYRKISGNAQGFTVREASEIVRVLHLSPVEAVSIFFDGGVAPNATYFINKDKPNEYTYIDPETNCEVTLVFAEKKDLSIKYGIANMLFSIYLRQCGFEDYSLLQESNEPEKFTE